MVILHEGAGLVVSGDVRTTFAAVDDALLNGARMCASILETTQGSDIPVAETQELLRSVTAGLAAVVGGRAEMVAAVKQMHRIKGQSNLAPVDYGCPDGWSAKLPDAPRAANISQPIS